MRHLLFVSLCLSACATDDPADLASGQIPVPVPSVTPLELIVSQIAPGQPMRATARDAMQGTEIYFILGTHGPGSYCPPALQGSCIPLQPPLTVLGHAVANSDQWASGVFQVPRSAPAGINVQVVAAGIDINGRTLMSPAFDQTTGLQACPAIYSPVCAINGQTYDSPCVAEVSGWFIDHPGPC